MPGPGFARNRKLTPTQEVELLAWDKARKALGTYKTKAHDLGVTEGAITKFLCRYREREHQETRGRAKQGFYQQLKTLPF